MDYADLLRRLWRLRRLVGLAGILALATAFLSLYSLSFFGLESKRTSYGTSSGQILVDSARSPVTDLRQDFTNLAAKAALYSAVFQTEEVKRQIQRAAGLPPDADLELAGTDAAPRERSGNRRGDTVARARRAPQLSVQAQQNLPLIDVQATAPTLSQAKRLVDATVSGAQDFLLQAQQRQDVPAAARASLRSLGPADGEVVTEGPTVGGALINGAIVLVVLSILLLVVDIGILKPPDSRRLDGYRLTA